MGNEVSSPSTADNLEEERRGGNSSNTSHNSNNPSISGGDSKPAYMEFITSAGKTIGQATGVVCGSLNDTFDEHNSGSEYNDQHMSLLQKQQSSRNDLMFASPEDDKSLQSNPMSTLFARALLNEVTDNPSTMTPAKMAEREKKLLKAQMRANSSASKDLGMRAIGGQGTVKSQMERAGVGMGVGSGNRIIPQNIMPDHRSMRAQMKGNGAGAGTNGSASGVSGMLNGGTAKGKHSVTIGLMLSCRHTNSSAGVGHPDTVTRQTAFDFNKLQDREYKYVSSTDTSGWRAGGGEKGGPPIAAPGLGVNESHSISNSTSDEHDFGNSGSNLDNNGNNMNQKVAMAQKVPSPDMVHIPIITIDCESEGAVNAVIAAIARGEVFIPHMSVMPEGLGVNGISPPDLVVRFGCERNDDFPPEEWPNWCLEFMHNQLYEYFSDMGARWMKRPFQITLAKKVRWKTVKHMNKYFAHSETVINSWRENGPQYLDPQLAHIEGGATPEEVARPHGIYLLRNGRPTNYFAPNFEPPYTTKMTRSLLQNVIAKSWDKKRRDWSTKPIPIVTPSLLLSTMCGCAEPNQGGFIAREATNHFSPIGGGGTFFNDAKYNDYDYTTSHDLNFNENVKEDRNIMQGIKLIHQDSGITRSQIGQVRSPSSSPIRNTGNSEHEHREREPQQHEGGGGVRKQSNDVSRRPQNEDASYDKAPNKYAFEQQSNGQKQKQQQARIEESRDHFHIHNGQKEEMENNQEPQQQLKEDSYSSPFFGRDHYEKPKSQAPRELDYSDEISTAEDDMIVEDEDIFNSPQENGNQNPSHYKTPLTNNLNRLDMIDVNKRMGDNTTSTSQGLRIDETLEEMKFEASPSSPGRAFGRHGEEGLSTAASLSPSEITGNHSTGISVGESQTTVPIMNRSSATFIEQERERRKQREVEREKERRKIDELEIAIQEKLRIHEEKKKKKVLTRSAESEKAAAAAVAKNVEDVAPEQSLQTELSEAELKRKTKKEKKERRERKEKKRREKKERKERERSKSSQRDRGRSASRNSIDTEESRRSASGGGNVQQLSHSQKVNDILDSLSKENQENRRYKDDPLPDDSNDEKMEKIQQSQRHRNNRKGVIEKTHVHSDAHSQDGSFLAIKSSPGNKHQIFNQSSPSNGMAQEINSQASMDYSLDTASLMGDGSLLGGQFAGDSSVFTMATKDSSLLGDKFAGDSSVFTMGTNASDNKSLLSCVTRSTIHDDKSMKEKLQRKSRSNDSDDISLSLMASSSDGTDAIPSDEELFAVGWAKALDPSSGCYY
eukprot:CAMPEP_0194085370 /NCGR_PEP_ID=MMETSP0149-20130528/17403_1 /TAXON_ID=122233 /ORGANISM="Chaetoceros debilis, Strain MM31A-1" /LENGTH=1285 /DNA_ID=CAMNT_0038768241 /DNA_START=463 /DNA_END=4317 /DNA_ORIENTATION=-